uniref:Putative secreted protein n=1 Tax=Amblyomma parvum TaxID=251391 RepID=A0A023FZY0_AMBPA
MRVVMLLEVYQCLKAVAKARLLGTTSTLRSGGKTASLFRGRCSRKRCVYFGSCSHPANCKSFKRSSCQKLHTSCPHGP